MNRQLFLLSLRIVTSLLVLFLGTGCFLDSKITRLEQLSLTVEKKINLTAQISSLSLIEGSSFSLDLTLDQAHSIDSVVQLTLSGGTSGLTRFSAAPTTVLFTAGQTSQTVVFTTIDDLTVQGNEIFTVQFSCGLSNMQMGTSSISFTVLDNDVAPLPSVTVAKIYPINGANWLSYIKGNNGGTRFFNQPDTACVGNETGSTDACIHAGDKLKVVATGFTTCTGLTITDYLDAFEWICETPGGVATFYSVGVKLGKGLSDLIDFTNNDWLNNFVTVKLNNTAVLASTSGKWWTNPIASAPSSAAATQVLSGYPAGTILTIANSSTSLGYNIDQDSIGLVVKNGSTLTYGGSAANCSEFTGEVASPNYKILICTGGQKYVWVEGSITGAGGTVDHVVLYTLTKFSRLNKIRVAQGGTEVTMMIYHSSYNTVTDVEIKAGTGYGFVWLEDATYNTVTKLKASYMRYSMTYSAVNMEFDCNYNVIQDINISNWDARAIQMHGNNNILGKVFASNTSIVQVMGQNHVVNHVTTSNNSTGGFFIDNANNVLVNQLYSGTSTNEVFVKNSTYSTFSQVAVRRLFNYSAGFDFDNTNLTKFTNNILIDSDTSSANKCRLVSSGAFPGLVNSTCGNLNNSDANWVYYPYATANPLVGTVASDSMNAHGSSGTINWASITDWLNFENPFRSWSSQTLGQCLSGSCVLYDYRIRTGDALVKNRSGDGSTANAAFTAGATCPAAVHGNKSITDSHPVPHTFLINAFEIYGDGVGNDNTLCESNEDCLYSPNFGAYQGEGDYKANGTCTFQNGNVTGVKMYAYPINGG